MTGTFVALPLLLGGSGLAPLQLLFGGSPAALLMAPFQAALPLGVLLVL